MGSCRWVQLKWLVTTKLCCKLVASRNHRFQQAKIRFLTKWLLITTKICQTKIASKAICNNSSNKFKKLLDTSIQAHKIHQNYIQMILRHQIQTQVSSKLNIEIQKIESSTPVLGPTRLNKIIRFHLQIFKICLIIREILCWVSIIIKHSSRIFHKCWATKWMKKLEIKMETDKE